MGDLRTAPNGKVILQASETDIAKSLMRYFPTISL